MFTVNAGRNLFQRVIMQSGSALSPAAMMYNPLPITEALAARLNCSLDDQLDGSTLRLLHCLKQVPQPPPHCVAHDKIRHIIAGPLYSSH